jgi:hypothetical protein
MKLSLLAHLLIYQRPHFHSFLESVKRRLDPFIFHPASIFTQPIHFIRQFVKLMLEVCHGR